jgi:hypothetical protein
MAIVIRRRPCWVGSVPEFANLPVKDLTAIWERQAQKLVESGVPRERVADSLRIAALNFETRMLSLAAQELTATYRARAERTPLRDAARPTPAPESPRVPELRDEENDGLNADAG